MPNFHCTRENSWFRSGFHILARFLCGAHNAIYGASSARSFAALVAGVAIFGPYAFICHVAEWSQSVAAQFLVDATDA